jgi:hypothetical protein
LLKVSKFLNGKEEINYFPDKRGGRSYTKLELGYPLSTWTHTSRKHYLVSFIVSLASLTNQRKRIQRGSLNRLSYR